MSVTLKTDHGEFIAETVKDAERMAKKAAKAAAKQADADNALRQVAYLKAQATGFAILRRMADEGGKMPRGWKYYPVDHKYGPRYERNYTVSHKRSDTVILDTEGGQYRAEFYGCELLGHAWNGSGFTIAFWVRDSHNDTVTCYAPGVHEGQCVCERLPATVVPELFKRDEAEAA